MIVISDPEMTIMEADSPVVTVHRQPGGQPPV